MSHYTSEHNAWFTESWFTAIDVNRLAADDYPPWRDGFCALNDRLESHIEVYMLIGLFSVFVTNRFSISAGVLFSECLLNPSGRPGGEPIDVRIEPQRQFSLNGRRYRADFHIQARAKHLNRPQAEFIIECDGKEHHLVKRFRDDRCRDLAFNLYGLRTVRFASADLLDDCILCAWHVRSLLWADIWRRRDQGAAA